MNCIENLFGWAEESLDQQYVANVPKDAEETERRFQALCDEAGQIGEIKGLTSSMPHRFKAVIEADGGPPEY